jgi:hypothetical protein
LKPVQQAQLNYVAGASHLLHAHGSCSLTAVVYMLQMLSMCCALRRHARDLCWWLMLHVPLALLAAGPPSTATASTALALTQLRTTWSLSGNAWSTTQTPSQVGRSATCTSRRADGPARLYNSSSSGSHKQQCAINMLCSNSSS